MTAGRLADHVALVTGAGTGIGRAVAERFVTEGARVGVLVRSDDEAADLRARLGEAVCATVGDVRSAGDQRSAVADTIGAFGRLDVAVANAGVWDFARRLDQYDDDSALEAVYEEVFDVNVRGALLTAAAARSALQDAGGSLILTVSSSGSYAGGGGPVYVASKHALVGLIRQLAFELAPEVRVNGVAPGATLTPLRGPEALGLDAARLDEIEGFADRVARQVPLGFVSAPEDHASWFVLLASRTEARFTTAALLPSDGGLEVRGGGRRRRLVEAEA